MIRMRKAPRPDAACLSADVLTPPERAATRGQPKGWCVPEDLVFRQGTRKWGDDAHIRAQLLKLKGKVCTSAD